MGELHPQMKAILDLLAKRSEGMPKLHEVTPQLGRFAMEATFTQFWNEDAPPIAKMADREMEGPRGPIPIRLYDPEAAASSACLIYFHGGGFVIGSIASHDGICRRLANYSGLRVISVGYRLAPEHKFPQPLEDCVASVRWIAAHAPSLGVDPANLFVGGDSAGANLALVTAMLLRDAGGPALKGAVLLYGTYVGDLETPSVKAFGGGDYFLTTEDMKWFSRHYLNGPQDLKDFRAYPIHGNLAGLPPLFIAAAEFDPLLDDSAALAARLTGLGAPHRHVVWPGVTHGCLHMTRMLDPADGFLRDIAAWMKQQSATPAESKTAGTA
ncbi:MAG TPA: alpha/beta hydrolase fold domain-containing protein [Candidatus Acidoferrales bacterium]|nr:alpha/beta hydrolase fold domain-containing protein [Candidatus Acidoferrales bacterium]